MKALEYARSLLLREVDIIAPFGHKRLMDNAANQQNSPSLTGKLALLLTALIWGLTFPLIRSAVQDISPNYFVFLRFLLTTLLMLPFILRNPNLRSELRPAAIPGISLGFIIAVGYLAQTIGLQTVDSPRAAFITGTAVLIVPFLSPFFGGGFPRAMDWASALVVTVGLYLLLDPSMGNFSVGDIWIGLCALSVAIHIHLVKRLGQKGFNDATAVSLQVVGVCLASLLTLPTAATLHVNWSTSVIVSLLFCSIFGTIVALYLQIKFQKQVSAERAAVIFSAEPVFATLFGYLLLGEGLSGRALVGAAIIFVALTLSTVRLPKRAPRDPACKKSLSFAP